MSKVRLDALLMARGMVRSREKARALILAGEVQVNGMVLTKPGTAVDEEAAISLSTSRLKYVSRGGLKLEKALQEFKVNLQGKTVLDIGASTGGFTDCCLQNGASRIYAVDVGYGQLDWKLRNDSRVTVMERTNIRYLTIQELGEPADIVTMDVSFISTALIFPVIKNLLSSEGQVVSLIKPQFEAGRDKVGKKGVVKDPLVHREVLLNCIAAASAQGLSCQGVCFSPITGPQGNIEFFIFLQPGPVQAEDMETLVKQVVDKAHAELEVKAR